MSNIQTTNDIKSDENAQVQMTAETYRFVMSWNQYPEPVTGERHVKLGLHVRMPDFSVLNFKDGIRCFPAYGPTVLDQREPTPGAGFCEGNNYGKKSKSGIGEAASRVCWQTPSSKAAWNEHVERLHEKEVASIRQAVSPEVPHSCIMCREIDPSKKACKLPIQGMGSLCSIHKKHRRLIVTPANKEQAPYWGSLRQKLDEFEKKSLLAKIWRVSTLPTFNRNDGKFIRIDKDTTGKTIRVYRDSDPRMVPEVAFSHDRTEDSSGYDECAFPDDWKVDLTEPNGNEDTVFMDINDNSDVKKQCFEMPKPNWVSVIRTRHIFTGTFRANYMQIKSKELNRVWHWDPEAHKFTFTVEEHEVTTDVKRDIPIMRTEEYPTLINVMGEEQFEKELRMMSKVTGDSVEELRARNTILVQSSTVVTRSERNFYSAKREIEKQKWHLTGYLILKDAKEGIAMAPKHKWPVHPKRVAAPMIQVPVPARGK